jgi:site-specific DNA-cytosine methylase
MTTAVDAFCGLGGWSTAASRLGVHVRHALNHDPDALSAHQKAHPNTRHHLQDIAEFDFELIDPNDCNILLASPSCKGSSTCGAPARKGTGGSHRPNIKEMMTQHKGQRSLALHVISAAEALRPDVVLVENVVGMKDWVLFDEWLRMLRRLGYYANVQTLEASKYGAATERERLIVTASLDGPLWLDGRVTAPYERRRVDPTTMRPHLDPHYSSRNRWHSIDDKPERTRDLIRSKQRQSGLRFGILNNVGDGVRMRSFDEPAPTLTTKSGTQLMYVADDRVRILNPLELARIMGWRDSEVAHALPKSRAVCSRLIGNAIPVPLAEGVLRQVLKHISLS